jgi:hypothetical protein
MAPQPALDSTVGRRMLLTALSGMVGGFLAVLADVAQKDDASAVLNIASGIAKLNIKCQPFAIAIVLVLLAGAICLILDAANTKAAFYIGASILTLIMTLVPVRRSPSIESALPALRPVLQDRLIRPALFWQEAAPAVRARRPTSAGTGLVNLTLTAKDKGSIGQFTVEIRNPDTGAITARSTYATPNNVELRIPPGRVELRISVSGYKLARQTLTITPGQTQEVAVDLEPSIMPLGLQKLLDGYVKRSPTRVSSK